MIAGVAQSAEQRFCKPGARMRDFADLRASHDDYQD